MRQTEHPGKILLRDFMEPASLSCNRLATALRIPANRLTEIVRGRRSITADTALRLALFFDNEPMFWLAKQAEHDLAIALQSPPEIRKRKE